MLNDQISSDLKDAMKAQNATTLSTLRLLKSALKNKQIDLMRELTDEEIGAIIRMQIKQLKEGVEMAEKAERAEMAEGGKREIAILEKYLPAQLGDAELERIVKDAIAGSGATSKADAGKAMGAAMKAVAGRADGSRVKAFVNGVLVVFVLTFVSNLSNLFFPELASAAAQNAQFAASGARILRVFLMLMGIVSVNFIIMGAVSVMTASGRDHGHHHGLQQMATGIFGTILMAGLVVIATAMIDSLE